MWTRWVVLVVGLPGSGKTTWATQQLRDGDCLVDDIKSLDELPADGAFERVFVIDPNFCRTSEREAAVHVLHRHYGSAMIKTVYFENDPEQCRINVDHRDDGRKVDGAITLLSQVYVIPDKYVDVIPVFKEDG